MPQVIGIVLAGGEGRRLGRPKGELMFDGRTLAEQAAGTLRPVCGSVLVSLGAGMQNPAPEFGAVHDLPPAGRGPLAGLAAAFDVTGQAHLMVLACDYPRVTTGLIRRLLDFGSEQDDLVMVTDTRGRDHPLVGVWRRSSAAPIRQALEDRHYKVRALLAELSVRRVGPSELTGFDLDRLMLNVNRLDDLVRLTEEPQEQVKPPDETNDPKSG
jgi:molybdopterin-guanine dinucleotide biosynthesis protein A